MPLYYLRDAEKASSSTHAGAKPGGGGGLPSVTGGGAGSSPPARLAVGTGIARQRLLIYPIEEVGEIRVDVARKQFNAHCHCLGQSPERKAHRTAKTRASRINSAAQKAPLALLIQWLRLGPCYDNRKDHKDSSLIITESDRLECRRWMCQQPELQELVAFEAEWNGVDVVVEPKEAS